MNRLICLIILCVTTMLASASFASLPDSDSVRKGRLVFISGQGGGTIGQPDDMGVAIEEAILSIKKIAKQNGGSLDDIVKLDVYLADLPKDFDALNSIEERYFHKPFPARTVVGAVIPKKHTVEINAIMVLSR